MVSILSYIPAPVFVAVVGIIAGFLAREAVVGWRALVKKVKAKFGVELPDNPTVEADIEAIVKALFPVLVKDAETNSFDLKEVADTIEKAIKSVNPNVDTSKVAEHVAKQAS